MTGVNLLGEFLHAVTRGLKGSKKTWRANAEDLPARAGHRQRRKWAIMEAPRVTTGVEECEAFARACGPFERFHGTDRLGEMMKPGA
jgi:hypothetical protein